MKEAHTAEHIFMGSLKRLKPDAEVKKVAHEEKWNLCFVHEPSMTWTDLMEAQRMANKVIWQARSIREYFFSTLEEARQAFPGLRAMEERISGKVRVIEVEGYDYAACAQIHVQNSRECRMILVTGFKKSDDGVCEIRFEAGERAVNSATSIAAICLRTAEALGATIATMENAAINLKHEVQELKKQLAVLVEEKLDQIPFEEKGGVRFYSSILDGFDEKWLVKKAGELVQQPATAVLLADRRKGFIVLCRSKELPFNSSQLLQNAVGVLGGKGGGKSEFASGSVPPERLNEAFAAIRKACLQVVE